jgi:hypothetical protein
LTGSVLFNLAISFAWIPWNAVNEVTKRNTGVPELRIL